MVLFCFVVPRFVMIILLRLEYFRRVLYGKGPFIFYEIGGAGGIEGGAMKKKLVLKGGPSKKISSVRGGHSKNYPKIL